ncbi:recombinase family protein [Seonamhaeicola marinus]|uniref:Recombinase family protein n=1 Tax=Seonamhaeicola marinus TaxID=1912246 RepID=A0A5D0I4A5_9FLAO|nr:recombinase family protein [Seonamhaeicola marinus]TYA78535.1 hypothetical protein FUA24_09270 [Seonamhaeicola marinus]
MLGIYTRLSREDETSNSIKHQIKEGISFAQSEGFNYKIYNEGEGVSGTLKIEDRPVLLDLVSDVRAGKITHIWMRNQNRLARNGKTYHGFISEILKHDVKVYFDDKLIDFRDPKQSLVGSILSSIHAFEAQTQSDQTKKVLKSNASKGIAHGIMPYGYCRDENKKMIIDEEEREVVERIYRMSLSGIGGIKIAEILNEEGVPTRYNKMKHGGTLKIKNRYTNKVTMKKKSEIKWSGKTVHDIIKNKVYYGVRVFGGNEYKVDAIFEKWYWKKVNDNLKKNRNNSGKSVTHKYLLKGLVECSGGRNMYGRTRINKKDNYYTCSGRRYNLCGCKTRSINIDVLEGFIWNMFFIDGELLKLVREYFDRDSKLLNEIEDKITKQLSLIKSLEQEKTRAIQLVMKGVLSEKDVAKEKERVEKSIDEAGVLIYRLKEQRGTFDNSNQLIEQLEIHSKAFKSPPEILEHIRYDLPKPIIQPATSFEDKSAIIKQYVKQIKITSDDELKLYNIRIIFNLPLKPQNFVMNYYKRVPYINSLETMRVLYKSKEWKRNMDKERIEYYENNGLNN